MATEVADLYVLLRGSAAPLIGEMKKAEVGAVGLDSKLGGLMGSLAGVGVAAVAVAAVVGVASLDLASKFDAAMERVHTQAGAAQTEVDSMKAKVLALAGPTAQAPVDLANGLYHIESAGFRGSLALSMLQEAAKGATIGNADLETVSQAMIGTIASGIKGVHGAADAMAALNATVGTGDMKMQGLASAIGTGILPSARNAGLAFTDVAAALATITDNATSPDEAATRLRMTFSMLAAPTHAAQKALAEIGIGSTQLGDDMRKPNGLLRAVMDLKHHLEASGLTATEQNAVIARAFGGGRTSGAINTLLTETGRLQDKYKDLGTTATRAKAYQDAMAATQDTLAYKLSSLKDHVLAVGTSIGNDLQPYAKSFVDWLNNSAVPWIVDAGRNIRQWLGEVWQDVLPYLTAASHGIQTAFGWIKNTAVPWIVQAGKQISTWLGEIWPKVLYYVNTAKEGIGAAIQWIIDGPVAFIRDQISQFVTWWNAHWDGIKIVIEALGIFLYAAFQVFSRIISITWNIIVDTTKSTWNAVMGVVQVALAIIKGIIGVFLDIISGHWGQIWQDILDMVSGAWDGIVHAVSSLFTGIVGLILDTVKGFGSLLWDAGKALITGLWDGAKSVVGGLLSWVGGLGSKVMDGIKGALDPSTAAMDGASVGNGVASGIRSSTPAAVSAAASLGHAVNATLNAALQAKALPLAIAASGKGLAPTPGAQPTPANPGDGGLAAAQAALDKAIKDAAKTGAGGGGGGGGGGSGGGGGGNVVKVIHDNWRKVLPLLTDLGIEISKKMLDGLKAGNATIVGQVGTLGDNILKAAKTALTTLQNSADQMVQSIADSLTKATDITQQIAAATGNATTMASTFAGNGVSGTGTAAGSGAAAGGGFATLLTTLQGKAASLDAFNSEIGQLRTAGLNNDMLQQIINAGAETGGKTALAVLSGGAGGIAQLNSTGGQIGALSKQIGALASGSQYGDQIATAMKQVTIDNHLVNELHIYLDGKHVKDAVVKTAQKDKRRNGKTNLA